MKRIDLVLLIEIAIMAAIAYVLGQIKLYQMPNGGSVSLEMLPIVIMAFRRGVKPGVLTGLLLGGIQIALGGYVISFIQVMLDYILAFGVVGFASAIGKKLPQAITGIIVASFLRFMVHFIAGVFVWEVDVWGSIVYNGPYMIASAVIVILVYIPLSKNKQIMNP